MERGGREPSLVSRCEDVFVTIHNKLPRPEEMNKHRISYLGFTPIFTARVSSLLCYMVHTLLSFNVDHHVIMYEVKERYT
jgi:hypothetical protein